MDYEKLYKEALETGKALHKNGAYRLLMEEIFPELAESEDEKIRKALIEHCKNQAKPYIDTGNECPQIQSWIDWLEKQSKDDMIEALRLEYEKGKSDALQEQRKEWTAEDLWNRNEIADILQEYNRDDLIDWLEKQGKQHCNVSPIDDFATEFEKQVSYLIASSINKENDYTADYVKWVANALLNYAKKELEKQGSKTHSQKDAKCFDYDDGKRDEFKDSIQVGDHVTRNEEGVLVNLSQLKRDLKKENPTMPKKADLEKLQKIQLEHIGSLDIQIETRYDQKSTLFTMTDYPLTRELYVHKLPWGEDNSEEFKKINKELKMLL